MENKEVLLTSESGGQLWNCCVWDFNTGTSLGSIKGGKCGVSSPRTMSTIGTDYLVSAEPGKPIINIWSFLRKDIPQLKIVSPGVIGALTVTPDGTFCLASVAEKVHIWQISTGELLTVMAHHYQSVTCLRTTDDGSFFISAGEDNLVFVCKLAKKLNSVLNGTTSSVDDTPFYTWSHHSLPVTDVCVGKGGRRARVVTVSLDHTLRLYTLRTGELLVTVIMEVSLMSVTMDLAEFFIITGGSDGRIFQVNLKDPPKSSEYHFSLSVHKKDVFAGHSKAVTCLALSMDGQVLISGSDDQSVKIWDIFSQQCLRSLSHKGPITNVMLIPAMIMQTLTSKANPSTLCVHNFNSFLCGSDNLEGTWEHKACISIQSQWQTTFSRSFEEAKSLLLQDEKVEVQQVLKQMEELQKFNDSLYDNTINKILLT